MYLSVRYCKEDFDINVMPKRSLHCRTVIILTKPVRDICARLATDVEATGAKNRLNGQAIGKTGQKQTKRAKQQKQAKNRQNQ